MAAVTSAAVLKQLHDAGVMVFVRSVIPHDGYVTGKLSRDAIGYLAQHPEFHGGPALLHDEVGQARIEFRSKRGSFGDDTSLQIVIGIGTGKFYADLDKWSPYESLGGFLKHNVLEVLLPRWLKRKKAE